MHHLSSGKIVRPLAKFILILASLGCLGTGGCQPKQQPVSQQVRVLCAGDSVTQGINLYSPEESYPAYLGRMLGKEYEVMNAGMIGSTMLRQGDLPYWNQALFQSGAAFSPNIVVLMLGTNDSKPRNWKHKAEFEGDTLAMIEHFSSLWTKPKVYLCLPTTVFPELYPKISTTPSDQQIDSLVLESEIKPILRRASLQANVPLIDIGLAMAGKSVEFPDGIHPNGKGNEEIAKVVLDQIRPTNPGKL
jgi:lysophospholipase L1-like esterase